jgi:hypothetical protein
MAIVDLQRRIREVGRIRLGVQVEKGGKTFPRKLARFRFTSPDRTVIEACAALCGGTVEAWRNDDRDEWEVISNAKEIRILIPPSQMALTQFYEQWAKGFNTHRCNGEWNEARDVACTCDPGDRECKATTRLSVILPDIPGLGVWRVESHGWYAAVELRSAVELIGQLVGPAMIPARLRLDQRELRRLDKGEAVVRKIVVPVIDIDVSLAQVQALGAGGAGAPALPAAPAAPDWQPVPPAEAPPNPPSLEDQLAQVDQAPPAKPRKNAAAPLRATGRKPRTAAERKRDDAGAATVTEHCPVCDKPYGAEPLVPNRDRLAGPTGTVPRYLHRKCHDEAPAEAEDGGSGPVEPAEPPTSVDDDLEADEGGDEDDAPAPGAIGKPTKPSAKMHSKIFALLAETLPLDTSVSGADADAQRQRYEYALSGALGEPIASHKDLSFEGGRNLIDALEGIKNGVYGWDAAAERLVHAETGALVDVTEEEEPF